MIDSITTKTRNILLNNKRYITNSQIVDDCPAHVVRSYDSDRPLMFNHNDQIAINVDGLYRTFTLGTTVGYALARNQDPIAEILRDTQNGHKHHWASLNSTVLCGEYGQTELIGFEFGDHITLEGRTFELAPDRNNNCKLI